MPRFEAKAFITIEGDMTAEEARSKIETEVSNLNVYRGTSSIDVSLEDGWPEEVETYE